MTNQGERTHLCDDSSHMSEAEPTEAETTPAEAEPVRDVKQGRKRGLMGCALAGAIAVVTIGGAIMALRAGVLFPGSRHYQAASPREAAVMETARRDVYPEDVRQSPEQHRDTLVAWAGVVRSMEATEEGAALVLRFDVEHRYFDWLEDIGGRARFMPSPRGEGRFRAAWGVPLAAREHLEQLGEVGDLLIVYGKPSDIRDGVVGLYPVEYMRLIPQAEVSDQVLDYGRPDAPAAPAE